MQLSLFKKEIFSFILAEENYLYDIYRIYLNIYMYDITITISITNDVEERNEIFMKVLFVIFTIFLILRII